MFFSSLFKVICNGPGTCVPPCIVSFLMRVCFFIIKLYSFKTTIFLFVYFPVGFLDKTFYHRLC